MQDHVESLSSPAPVQVPGFEACGVSAGLKPSGAPDLALLRACGPAVGAAVFTRNLVQAAPVLYDRELMARNASGLRAVVVNSRNANACTGEPGLRDARRMAEVTAEALGLPAEAGVFVMSTGVIGVPMPMDKIEAGIRQAASALTAGGVADAALAIMTTDTHPKTACRTVEVDGVPITVGGIAKGAGMIHPDMATMLGVVLTDAPVRAEVLDGMLHRCVETSFNAISVDGDTSTNDTCLVLSSGVAPCPPLEGDDARSAAFEGLLREVLEDLARQIAFDGEGASHKITLTVTRAGSPAHARRIGRTIATSPLVKTALSAADPNWGRILAAAGRAGVPLDPSRCSLMFGDVQVLRDGLPTGFDEERASAILAAEHVAIHLDAGGAEGTGVVWTCDLTHDYVTINADYRT